MIRFLPFLFLLSLSLSGQSIKKAYKLYEKGEIPKFRDALKKMDEKGINNSGKYFLYSKYYLLDRENRDALDSSYYYIKLSNDNFQYADDKLSDELFELNISEITIDSVIKVIDSIEYDFVKSANTIEEYKKYMSDHERSKFYSDALGKWHKLEFDIVREIDTWQAYKKFMDLYPQATDFVNAKSSYDALILKDKTSEMTLSSYEKFIENNPETPYRDSIEFLILKYYGVSNKIENFKNFIDKYPNSIHKKFVIQLLYHTNNRGITILDNLNVENALMDSLLSLSEIDKEYLIGIYEDESINFIDKKGKLIVNGLNNNFTGEILCDYDNKDFFILLSDNVTEFYNRKLFKFYESSGVSYIEDLGYGLIKVIKNSGLDIIHKSGVAILSGSFDDAYLIDGKYILAEKNDRYSLFTFLGDTIYDFIFDDVFQEGPFILFENTDNKLAVTSMDGLEKKILSKNFDISFTYDDYEYFDEGIILMVSGDSEELLDDKMNYIISPAQQRIDKYNFGWTASTDFGIRVVSDILSVPFSQLYQEVLSSPKYFIGKKNDLWEVKDLKSSDQILTGIDSVYRVGDSTLWYREGMKDALLFHNYKELLFDRNYKFKLLSPKSGEINYIKLFSDGGENIINLAGDTLPSAEYYYTVEKGNTFSFLSKKFNLSQSEILKLNNKKNKKLYIGEKIKVRGYVPSDVISDSLFLIEFNGKKGIADLNGDIIIEPLYDGITNYSDKDIILIKDQKFGNFNIETRKIIPPSFSRLLESIGNYYKGFEGKYGILDVEGRVIVPYEYDEVELWNDSSFIVKNTEGFHFVDLNRNKFSDFTSYSFISNEQKNIIEVNSDSGKGIYSTSHGEILKPVYDNIVTTRVNDDLFFLARREISDAGLLINLIVNQKGEIIVNQALDIKDSNKIVCE